MRKTLLLIISLSSTLFAHSQPIVQSVVTNTPWGGRTLSVTVHPVTTNEVIAASAGGGLFKSTNGGSTWRHLSNLPVFSMMDVKYNPVFSNKVIATCMIDTDTTHRIGIWLSSDRGETWTQLTTLPTPPARDRSRFPQRYSAYGISFDGSGVAYVGTDYGVAIGKAAHNNWSHVIHDSGIPSMADKMQNGVYSVQAFHSGKLIIGAASGVYYCDDMYLARPFRRSTSTATFFQGNIHGIAQSPYNEKDVFITPDLETLLYSGDTARNFVSQPMPVPGGRTSRTPLVIITRSSDPSKIDVYVHKVALFKKRYNKDRPNETGGSWDRVNVVHDDISHAAVVDNVPLYVVGDGGVFKKSGDDWNSIGRGGVGYNALQIYQAWGQRLVNPSTMAPVRTYYYFGTQDNNLWGSSDGGASWPHDGGIEGGGFQGPAIITDASARNVVSINNSTGANQFSGPAYASMSVWRDPTPFRGNPKYAGNGIFVQITFDTATGEVTVNKTTTGGASWSSVARISGYRLWQGEKASTDSSFSFYIPYSRALPTTNGIANIGLLRVQRKLMNSGRTENYYVRNMDTVSSLKSLAVYPADFAWPTVYGFDHNDSYRLLAPDSDDKVMKWSFDAGMTWRADRNLTSLITENGRYVFYESVSQSSVWTVSFNPADSRQIAIGTKDAGIIYTSNGGMNWCRIPGSKQIPNITSIWWDFDGTALVSSYGRGLWRFRPAAYRSVASECVSNLIQINVKDLVLKPKIDVPLIIKPGVLNTEPKLEPAITIAPKLILQNPLKTRPVVNIVTGTFRGGEMVVGDDRRITISGAGFAPGINASLEWNDKTVVKSMQVKPDGSIKHSLVFKQLPGIYTLDIVQYLNGKKIETPVIVKIPFTDK